MNRYELEYADGYYITKDGEGIIDLTYPENREFAQFVCDALNQYEVTLSIAKDLENTSTMYRGYEIAQMITNKTP